MKPLLATLILSACMTACAGLPSALPGATLPAEAQAEPERYLLVTIRNLSMSSPSRAGSTRRGYDGAPAYVVSSSAQSLAQAIARDYGIDPVAGWPIAVLRVHCLVYRVPEGAERTALLSRLAADPRVELAQPLQSFSTSATGYNDRYVSLQRAFDEMSVPAAHRWSRGEGVVVALIDSGVDARHPDLAGRVRAYRNFVETGTARLDQGRHGTEIAGVIAAVGNNGEGIVGVAPGVELLALRACWQARPADDAAVCNTFTLAQALTAAIDARADVINLSLVGPADPLLSALTEQATAAGSIVVGAVPTGGRMDGFPAGAPGVLAVEMAEGADNSSAALRAPGKEILTLAPGGAYDFATGSSVAVANVSGIVALLRARRHLSAAEAKALLVGSMRRIDVKAGAVRSVDACIALSALLAKARVDCPHAVDAESVRDLHATRGDGLR